MMYSEYKVHLLQGRARAEIYMVLIQFILAWSFHQANFAMKSAVNHENIKGSLPAGHSL